MHGYPAARNPAHPVLVGSLSLLGGYILATAVAVAVFNQLAKRRRSYYSVTSEPGEYGPVAVISYEGPEGSYLRLHEFHGTATQTEQDLVAEANRWADRLAAL
jgi:hypothetical protein